MSTDDVQPGAESGAVDSLPARIPSGIDAAPRATGAGLEEDRMRNAVRSALFGTPQVATRIGRFVLLDELGRGGMGVVYSAYDEQLDRKVAIKLLKYDRRGGETERERLLREAQAMARLSHPNVVQVYEVGEHEGQLFVAMEFVQGGDLQEWLDGGPHHWRDVTRLFSDAGRGLSAAHRAGLVHRDFKPANVLSDSTGAVKITDFGLTRITTTAPDTLEETPLGEASLTATGTLLGTPAYMAPEQWTRRKADARTDQFAFCVALFEAIYGERPFSGETISALGAAVLQGEVVDLPRPEGVPDRILRSLRRGLSADPDDRFPDMDDLLRELDRDPNLARRRWVLGGALVAATTGVAALAIRPEEATDSCSGGAETMSGVWSPARGEAIEAAFVATRLPYARVSAQNTVRQLDQYAREWQAAHREACLQGRRGERSGELLDASMACLERRLIGLGTVVDALESADETGVQKSSELASSLPSIAGCQDALALSTWLRPPEDNELARQVAGLRDRIAKTRAVMLIGELDEALAEAEAIHREGGPLPYAPVRAEAGALLGDLQGRLGDREASQATLTDALRDASAGRHIEVTVDVAKSLAFAVGVRDGDAEGASRMLALAGGALEAKSAGDAEYADLAAVEAAMRFRQGKYPDAARLFEAAIARRAAGLGEDAPPEPTMLVHLGLSYVQLGRLEDAEQVLDDARERLEETRGPAHPHLASIFEALGHVALYRGDLDLAGPRYEQALEIRRTALGPNHPNVGIHWCQIASVDLALREYDRALEHQTECIRILEAARGHDHADVASAINNLGGVLEKLGRREEALQKSYEAMQIRERVLEPDSLDLASSYGNYGIALDIVGRTDEGLPYIEKAWAIIVKTDQAEAPLAVQMSLGYGFGLQSAGRLDEARGALERARAITTKHSDYDRELHGRASFGLAKVLWEIGEEPERARRLALEARQAHLEGSAPDKVETIDEWLAERATAADR